jgi:hypothetical protein
MIEPAVARCARTAAILEAILDGEPAPLDRSHVAACATCRRESERALRFTHSLATTATEASEAIPNPALVRGRARMNLRLAPIMTVASAVAAGLLIAAIVATRGQPPAGQGPSAFSSPDAGRQALASLDFSCRGLICESTAPTHVHRVQLTEIDGRVVEVEARIESTDGKRIDPSGGDVLFGRIAGAVLAPESATAIAGWLRDAYTSCGAGCSIDLEEVGATLAIDERSIRLELRER